MSACVCATSVSLVCVKCHPCRVSVCRKCGHGGMRPSASQCVSGAASQPRQCVYVYTARCVGTMCPYAVAVCGARQCVCVCVSMSMSVGVTASRSAGTVCSVRRCLTAILTPILLSRKTRAAGEAIIIIAIDTKDEMNVPITLSGFRDKSYRYESVMT